MQWSTALNRAEFAPTPPFPDCRSCSRRERNVPNVSFPFSAGVWVSFSSAGACSWGAGAVVGCWTGSSRSRLNLDRFGEAGRVPASEDTGEATGSSKSRFNPPGAWRTPWGDPRWIKLSARRFIAWSNSWLTSLPKGWTAWLGGEEVLSNSAIPLFPTWEAIATIPSE